MPCCFWRKSRAADRMRSAASRSVVRLPCARAERLLALDALMAKYQPKGELRDRALQLLDDGVPLPVILD
jgi:hypothetical protein